ncbi:hypothetical protein AAL_05823 [Moelleriella libera RCEF 2490]|uniref:Uncharacterized protein n=1 Tax=Moelleriella libera RCEF 2490 TaxID=1081109 RepID=A0A168A3Y2_9HYPO|nr:hypothetical protein AAL_05823 [Moelleriella libera RCEF 2490]
MGKRDYLLMRQGETVVIDESHRFTLQRLEPSDPTRLHVHYMATSDGGPPWLLKMVRPLSRALRSESLSIETEAVLARWLSGTQPSSPSHGILHSHEVMQNDVSVNHRPHTHHVSIPQGFLPEFVRREYISSPHRVECLLTRPVQGILVSSLTEPLGKEHREVVDLQVGGLIREISMHRSPHGLFGRALAVLEAASNRDNARVQHHERLLVMSETHHCWSDAFTSLLEAVLRDAEDASVAVPYDKIRHHVRRLKHVLDEVRTPSLVILDAGHDSNTVVVWPGTENVQRNQAFVQGPASDAGPSSARQKGANPSLPGVVDVCANATSAQNAAIAKSRVKPAPKVIGVCNNPLLLNMTARQEAFVMLNPVVCYTSAII